MPFRCLLIATNTVTRPTPVFPLGMAQIAGALSQAGHAVRQYDRLAHENGARACPEDGLAALIADFSPQLIGLSIRNIDSTDSQEPDFFLEDTHLLLRRIRRHSTAPIVLGGSGFTLFPRRLMQDLGAEYGIAGAGEEALCRLVDEIAAGTPPPPGTLRVGSGARKDKDKDENDAPGRDPIPSVHWTPAVLDPEIASFYRQRGGLFGLQTHRGCPYSCEYCTYPQLEGRRYQFRDPEEIAAEVQRLRTDFGCRYLYFADSLFNDHEGHFREVAEALIRRGNRTRWCAYFRPDTLTSDDLKLLRRAGLHAIEFGTDAASDTTLQGLAKPFSFDHVLRVQERVAALEIPAAHFVIFGGPGETWETFEEGLANMERLGRCVVFAMSGIRILPRTPIHGRALREGILTADRDLLQPVFYHAPTIDRRRMETHLRQAWQGKRTRLYPIADSHGPAAELQQAGFQGPLWDLLLM